VPPTDYWSTPAYLVLIALLARNMLLNGRRGSTGVYMNRVRPFIPDFDLHFAFAVVTAAIILLFVLT
jgi:hypothetical protein